MPASADPPRPAAATILLRRSGRHRERGLQVLMVRRSPAVRFMPDVWVFPGGAVRQADDTRADADCEDAYRATALRELAEEAGIELDGIDSLTAFSRWITPTELETRYDVRFYVALAPAHTPPQPDNRETVEAAWFRPKEALESYGKGELSLVFPTVKHLEELCAYRDADDVLQKAPRRSLEPVRPQIVTVDGQRKIVLPDDD